MKILKIILFFICLKINSRNHRQRKLSIKRKISDGLIKANSAMGKYGIFAKNKIKGGINKGINLTKNQVTKLTKKFHFLENLINEENNLRYYYKHSIDRNYINVNQRILQIKLTMTNMDSEYNEKINSLNQLLKGEKDDLIIEDRNLDEKITEQNDETLEIEREIKDDLELKNKDKEEEILEQQNLKNNEMIIRPENIQEVSENNIETGLL